jgi:hypothetical protein
MAACAARGCNRTIQPHLLMCLVHWRLVSKPTQASVWRNYVVGQNIETATPAYIEAMKAAISEAEIGEVKKKERQQEFLRKRFGGKR